MYNYSGQHNIKRQIMIKRLNYQKIFVVVPFHKYFGSSEETLRFPEVKSPCLKLELERVQYVF